MNWNFLEKKYGFIVLNSGRNYFTYDKELLNNFHIEIYTNPTSYEVTLYRNNLLYFREKHYTENEDDYIQILIDKIQEYELTAKHIVLMEKEKKLMEDFE